MNLGPVVFCARLRCVRVATLEMEKKKKNNQTNVAQTATRLAGYPTSEKLLKVYTRYVRNDPRILSSSLFPLKVRRVARP